MAYELQYEDPELLVIQLAGLPDAVRTSMMEMVRFVFGASQATKLETRAKALRALIDQIVDAKQPLFMEQGIRPCGLFTPNAHVADVCHACGFRKDSHS